MTKECTIIKPLPSGGQKTVQLAEHPDLGLVVIKKGEIKSFTSLERIRREVELLSELDSEYYPKQFHFNIDIKSKEFEIVEEYIEGSTLRDSFSKFTDQESIFTLLNELIKGLSIIWDRNIVHRDLKPENIIIKPDGKPCIIDLGIARFIDLESLTKTISPMGPCTPIYASPEQLSNNKNIIDQRTDFYVLGLIALELYLGVHPFDPAIVGNHFSIFENILQNKYVTSTDIINANEKIDNLVYNTIRMQPYERFRNHKLFNEYLKGK
ncbi:serine/threonine-protein kinase [Chryseobacterium sp. 2R14A]|uniref:serine/threonine-protein kinase n=1 Tax=Chryseobacterium sp. 2R14A TaxID=3380353 RepID=UPI003CF48D18